MYTWYTLVFDSIKRIQEIPRGKSQMMNHDESWPFDFIYFHTMDFDGLCMTLNCW